MIFGFINGCSVPAMTIILVSAEDITFWPGLRLFYTLSQYPDRSHPGKFPGENLLRKITPQRKTFGSFTSPTILHNLFHPGKNTSSLAVTIEFLDFTHHWIFGFHPMSFDITPVILLILLGVWQHLTGITAMWGNSSSRVLG